AFEPFLLIIGRTREKEVEVSIFILQSRKNLFYLCGCRAIVRQLYVRGSVLSVDVGRIAKCFGNSGTVVGNQQCLAITGEAPLISEGVRLASTFKPEGVGAVRHGDDGVIKLIAGKVDVHTRLTLAGPD